MKFALRLPGSNGAYRVFDFLDDTGSSHMLLYHADLVEVQQACGDLAIYLGKSLSNTPN